MRTGSEIFMAVIKRSNRGKKNFQRGPTFPSVRKSNCGKDGIAIMLASEGLSWTVEDTVVVISPLFCRSLAHYEYVAHSLRKFIVNVREVFSQHGEHLLRRQMLCLLISNDSILSQHIKIGMNANIYCFIGYPAITCARASLHPGLRRVVSKRL